MATPAEIRKALNFQIDLPSLTETQRLRLQALDLTHRVANLHRAAQALALPYTFDLVPVDKDKREKRILIGGMTAEILEDLVEVIMDEVVHEWLLYKERKNSTEAK